MNFSFQQQADGSLQQPSQQLYHSFNQQYIPRNQDPYHAQHQACYPAEDQVRVTALNKSNAQSNSFYDTRDDRRMPTGEPELDKNKQSKTVFEI